jgi:hypothetical protein
VGETTAPARMEQSVEGGGALLQLVLCEHLIELIADSCSHTRSGCGVLLLRMKGTWTHCRVDCAGRKGEQSSVQDPATDADGSHRQRRAQPAHPKTNELDKLIPKVGSWRNGPPMHCRVFLRTWRRSELTRGQRDGRPHGFVV